MKSTAPETSAVPRAKPAAPPRVFDVRRVRSDFPILSTQAYGRPLVYLDNGAPTQKPQAVIDRVSRYYREENANIHRGVYRLSQVATEAYEEARRKVARFINAPDEREVIFTRGTTEAINLVAASYARTILKRGDAESGAVSAIAVLSPAGQKASPTSHTSAGQSSKPSDVSTSTA